MPGDQVAHFARPEALDLRGRRQAHAQLLDVVHAPGLHETQLFPGRKYPVDDPDGADYAPVLVIERVEYQRLQGCAGVALGRRDASTNGVEQLGHPLARFGRNLQRLRRRDAEDGLDLGRAALGVGGGKVDLVEDHHDLEVVLEGEVGVGQGLGLDALGGVHQQDDALAGGQAAAHLVAEVDVAGRVDEVHRVALPFDPDVLGLDGDAPLSFDVHRVEVLVAHVTRVDGAGELEYAIGQRRLAVVDVGHDRKVADLVGSKCAHRSAVTSLAQRYGLLSGEAVSAAP